MSYWINQINKSRIPFPQRHLLKSEIHSDLDQITTDFGGFSQEELLELESVHSTQTFKILSQLGHRKKFVETFIAFIPLIIAVILITKEGTMVEFIKEGGLGMYAILAIGIFLLAREFRNVFRLIVVKDHAQENLRLDTSSLLLGCLAMMIFGIGWSVLGIYVSAGTALASNASLPLMMVGIKESLTPTILSAFISSLVLLSHYGTRRVMHIWRAPISD